MQSFQSFLPRRKAEGQQDTSPFRKLFQKPFETFIIFSDELAEPVGIHKAVEHISERKIKNLFCIFLSVRCNLEQRLLIVAVRKKKRIFDGGDVLFPDLHLVFKEGNKAVCKRIVEQRGHAYVKSDIGGVACDFADIRAVLVSRENILDSEVGKLCRKGFLVLDKAVVNHLFLH